jgi:hypothetical protein
MSNVLTFRYPNEVRLFLSYFEVHWLETPCLYRLRTKEVSRDTDLYIYIHIYLYTVYYLKMFTGAQHRTESTVSSDASEVAPLTHILSGTKIDSNQSYAIYRHQD